MDSKHDMNIHITLLATTVGVFLEEIEWKEELVPSVGDHIVHQDALFQIVQRTFVEPDSLVLTAVFEALLHSENEQPHA